MPVALKANPTFNAMVKIPLPGDDKKHLELNCVFKHKDRNGVNAYFDAKDMDDPTAIKEIVESWDVEGGLTDETIETFLGQYHNAGRLIVKKWHDELTGKREGN